MRNKLNNMLKVVKLDEMEILPGHLAFYLIFILIPVVSFIGLLTNNLNINYSNYYINSIPNAVLSLVSEIEINSNNFNLIIFILISLLVASRGTKAIIISSNIIFKIKDKDNIKIRINSIIMVLILFLLIEFIVIVPIMGDTIINYLSNYFKETGNLIINYIYHIIKYPISIILMFIFIKILYMMSLNVKINNKYLNRGSLFTTITWLFFSRIYSIYLNYFNNYNLYFGTLSNILILLIWVYLLSYIFVLGIYINADNYLQKYS